MQVLGPAPPPGWQGPSEHLPATESSVLRGHEGPVLVVRFNPKGSYCLSGGKDRTIRLWNPHRGIHVKTYTGHGYDVRGVAVTSDNSKFTSCGGDRQVYLWDVATGTVIRRFRGHDAEVNAVAYSPNDDVVASAGYDQAVKLWDCRSKSIDPVQVLKGFRDSVTSVVVTPRGEIVAGSVDGAVRRFDARTGRLYTDELHASVTSVAVSKDGHCVLAACTDGCVRLLDRAAGDLLCEYRGHKHATNKLDCCFTPSGRHAVGSSEDGRVLYWELVEGELVESFQAHAGVVCSMSMHPDGSLLVTSSVDGSVRVWA